MTTHDTTNPAVPQRPGQPGEDDVAVSGRRPRSLARHALGTGVVAVLVIAFGSSLDSSNQTRVGLWIIYGMLALSLSFVWGHGGSFSFGQTLMFGLGAYSYGVVTINFAGSVLAQYAGMLVGVVVATAIAGIIGYFMFYGGVTDVYVAVITLASMLIFFDIARNTSGSAWRIGSAALGGFNGMTPIPALSRPDGIPLLAAEMFATLVVVAALVYLVVVRLTSNSFGRVVAGIRDNPERASLLGYDVPLHNLLVFMVGGAVAGLSGTLFATTQGIVTPDVFSLTLAGSVIVWVMFGGRMSMAGAFVGAAIVNGVADLADRLQIGGSTPFFGQTPLLLGALLILVVFVLPGGLLPSISAFVAKRTGRRAARADDSAEHEAAPVEALPPALRPHTGTGDSIELVGLRKAFGGLVVIDGVDMSFTGPGVHCLLGPNGAGKSTLFALISGRYRPTAGEVILNGDKITTLSIHQRAKRGLGLKMQVPSIFRELTVAENLWLAANASPAKGTTSDELAQVALRWSGLASRAQDVAGDLPHGQQQWLEIAMVLSGRPRLVLLDEPTAGMTAQETQRMAEVIGVLGGDARVLVVEHDMDFVRQLNPEATVLHQGRLFAKGTLAQLREDERVLDVYLGRGGHA